MSISKVLVTLALVMLVTLRTQNLCCAQVGSKAIETKDHLFGKIQQTQDRIVNAIKKIEPCVVHITGESESDRRTLGSGVIIDKDGLVLTNSHIVEKQKQLRVTMTDERKLDAKLIGRDPKTGIALIQISPETHAGVKENGLGF